MKPEITVNNGWSGVGRITANGNTNGHTNGQSNGRTNGTPNGKSNGVVLRVTLQTSNDKEEKNIDESEETEKMSSNKFQKIMSFWGEA